MKNQDPQKKKVLLHVYCAPCAGHVIQQLEKPSSLKAILRNVAFKDEGFSVTPFFYNPNIHPQEEYEKRLEELKKFIGDNLFIGDYDPEKWFAATKGFEHEPERGRRCKICYRIRLEKTAQLARQQNCGYFASTLSISPHKPANIINAVGLELAEKYSVNFLAVDWKKQDGFKKSCQLSKEFKFYRNRKSI